MPSTTPPGWYPDQNDAEVQRYWDGTSWTQQTRPAAPADTEPTIPLRTFPGPTEPAPWWKRRWVLVTGGVLVVLFVIGAITGGNDTNNASQQTATTPVPPTVTVTATPSTKPSPSTKASPKPKHDRPANVSRPSKAATSWTMPNQVGADLQASQDRIQAISGNPFFYTASRDATGQSRFQILDADWQVCSQKPQAGTTFDENTLITFFVVKDDEECP